MKIHTDLLITGGESASYKPQPSLWGRIAALWAKWLDTSCPECGDAKSCAECVVENNF